MKTFPAPGAIGGSLGHKDSLQSLAASSALIGAQTGTEDDACPLGALPNCVSDSSMTSEQTAVCAARVGI